MDYGIDRQRVRQTFRRGSSTRTKRHFTPLFETVTENGVTKNLHYLTAGTGLFAIFATQTNGESAMHYTLKDHQGSLTAGTYTMRVTLEGGKVFSDKLVKE